MGEKAPVFRGFMAVLLARQAGMLAKSLPYKMEDSMPVEVAALVREAWADIAGHCPLQRRALVGILGANEIDVQNFCSDQGMAVDPRDVLRAVVQNIYLSNDTGYVSAIKKLARTGAFRSHPAFAGIVLGTLEQLAVHDHQRATVQRMTESLQDETQPMQVRIKPQRANLRLAVSEGVSCIL